jgi:hypothetical protein
MAPVVNLNRFRKQKARAAKELRAAENRALYGRTKQERQAETAERRRADRALEGKKLGEKLD